MKWRHAVSHPSLLPCLALPLILLLFLSPVHAATDSRSEASGDGHEIATSENSTGGREIGEAAQEKPPDEYGDVTGEEAPSDNLSTANESSDEYGNIPEGEAGIKEEPRIADPLEPWNRAMYHFNDKLYFWLLKPTAKAYKYVVNEDFRGLFTNFYYNLKAPIRVVNNLLQGKVKEGAVEVARFFINSTIGVGGLKDCAKECFGVPGRDADFGQTLGTYGVGFGFYLVWPVFGPSSPRDTVGLIADFALTPTTYISPQLLDPRTVGLYAHEKINYTSFHLGDYEALKSAAIDPYVAIRDAYVQYRRIPPRSEEAK